MPELFQVSAEYALQAGSADPPGYVMWMPAGRHEIHATRGGKTAKLTVNVTEADAIKLHEALKALKGEGKPDPYVGFDHVAGPAGFWPEEFVWKSGEGAGIYVKARWTPKGKSAVVAGDGESAAYRYFSPTFLADEAGNIAGLPSSGEIGSLVNNPAFRRMLPVAASQSQTDTSMTEDEIKALKAENDKLTADLKKQKESAAAAIVAQAVEDGKIAAQDTATQDFWKASLYEKPESKTVLDALPVRFTVKAKQVSGQESVNAHQEEPVNGNALRARANDLLNAARSQGRCISWQQAWNAACAETDLLPSAQAVNAAA